MCRILRIVNSNSKVAALAHTITYMTKTPEMGKMTRKSHTLFLVRICSEDVCTIPTHLAMSRAESPSPSDLRGRRAMQPPLKQAGILVKTSDRPGLRFSCSDSVYVHKSKWTQLLVLQVKAPACSWDSAGHSDRSEAAIAPSSLAWLDFLWEALRSSSFLCETPQFFFTYKLQTQLLQTWIPPSQAQLKKFWFKNPLYRVRARIYVPTCHQFSSNHILFFFLNQYRGVSLRYNTQGGEPFVEFIFHYILASALNSRRSYQHLHTFYSFSWLPLPPVLQPYLLNMEKLYSTLNVFFLQNL